MPETAKGDMHSDKKCLFIFKQHSGRTVINAENKDSSKISKCFQSPNTHLQIMLRANMKKYETTNLKTATSRCTRIMVLF